MTFTRKSLFVLSALFIALPSLAAAQQPTPQEAQRMMQDPNALARLRQQIMSSGLTPDQVRARLREQGYPETMLDAYLNGGNGASADSVPQGEEVFDALTALGISDSTDVELLKCGIDPDSVGVDSASVRSPTRGTGVTNNGSPRDTTAAGKARTDNAKRLLRARCTSRRERIGRSTSARISSYARRISCSSATIPRGPTSLRPSATTTGASWSHR
jgi:hypothetical protein